MVLNKMVIELGYKSYVLCIVGYQIEIIISITNKYLFEDIESNKVVNTIVDRVCSLVKVRILANKPKLGNA